MNTVISVASSIGNDLRTRSFFRRDIERLSFPWDYEVTLDFDGVVFVSRSVADELCEVLKDYPSMKAVGMSGDVEKMYEVVVKGRNSPRVYMEVNTKVIHLKTMKEMEEFFATF